MISNLKHILKPITKKIPGPLRNKYFWVICIVVFWMMFFDKHDFSTNWRLSQAVKQMEKDRDYYKERIEAAKEDKKDLQTNMEKFAREHYYMKKSDEDVFIIEEESDNLLE